MQKQRYLFQRGSLFYFRITLPLDIRARLQKNEVKLSLGTPYLNAAHLKAQRLAVKVNQFISQHRFIDTDMQELTPGQLRDILDDFLNEMLDDSELHRALGKVITDEDGLDEEAESLSYLEGDFREELACRDYKRSIKWANELIADRGLQLDKEGHSYKVLCRELLKTAITCLQIEQERTYGNYANTTFNTGHTHYNQRGQNDKEPLSRAKLSEVIHCYVSEYDSSKGWTAKTKKENVAIYDLLVRIVGDIQVCFLDHATIRHFKTTLLRLPPNINKLACYKGKSIEEIISIPNLKTLSISTVNKYLIRISSLLSWASQYGYILKNYAEGLTLANNKRQDHQRQAFSQDDLKTFFSTPEYTNQTFKHPYQYWLPVLALYLGCRIEELCQLHLKDLIQVV